MRHRNIKAVILSAMAMVLLSFVFHHAWCLSSIECSHQQHELCSEIDHNHHDCEVTDTHDLKIVLPSYLPVKAQDRQSANPSCTFLSMTLQPSWSPPALAAIPDFSKTGAHPGTLPDTDSYVGFVLPLLI